MREGRHTGPGAISAPQSFFVYIYQKIKNILLARIPTELGPIRRGPLLRITIPGRWENDSKFGRQSRFREGANQV